jgi:putative FmdB family regulatory protein
MMRYTIKKQRIEPDAHRYQLWHGITRWLPGCGIQFDSALTHADYKMPIYVYVPTSGNRCEFCEFGFEIIQKIDALPLDRCPECTEPVKKTITAPNIASSGPSLENHNIDKHGFTRYQKLEKGVYEKTAGKGPKIISDKK